MAPLIEFSHAIEIPLEAAIRVRILLLETIHPPGEFLQYLHPVDAVVAREILHDFRFVRVAHLEDFADVLFLPLRRVADDAAVDDGPIPSILSVAV